MQSLREGSRWMLRLDDAQDLWETLTDFARSEQVTAASVLSGIGMLRTATLGFWNGQEYRPRDLTTPHELIALHGSIAIVDGAPSIHLHAGLADAEHRLVGGHLLRARIGVLAELYLETFPGKTFGRPMNESLGLRALDLEPEPSA